VDALELELLSSREGLLHHHAARGERDVRALAKNARASQLEDVVIIVDDGDRSPAEPDVERTGRGSGHADRGARGHGISGNKNAHPRQDTHERDVLKQLVATAVGANGDA